MDDSAVVGYAPDEVRTGERTGAAKLKWVIAVLAVGVIGPRNRVSKLVRRFGLLP